MNYTSYDVAVMNYPLFDKREDVSQAAEKFFKAPPVEKRTEVPLYIHIPFCTSLCDFCIYHRNLATQPERIEAYVEALLREIEMYASEPYTCQLPIGSVFIGGGTPTVLTRDQLIRILDWLHQSFNLQGCDITVECHIQNASLEKLIALREHGVTRVSTGIQTLQHKARRDLHMAGSPDALIQWLAMAKSIGFSGVSADLMYGLPGVTQEQFLQDLDQVLKLQLSHLSVYKTAIFAYTKLYREQQKSISPPAMLSEAEMRETFYQAHDKLMTHGYELVSTQEYGREKGLIRFWDLTYDGYGDNLSFGPSSFGYINGHCYQNESELDSYVKKLQGGVLPVSRISRRITPWQLMERAMIMGFRRGAVSLSRFADTFGYDPKQIFSEVIDQHVKQGYVTSVGDQLILTRKGLYEQGKVSVDYMRSIFQGVSNLKRKLCIGSHEMP